MKEFQTSGDWKDLVRALSGGTMATGLDSFIRVFPLLGPAMASAIALAGQAVGPAPPAAAPKGDREKTLQERIQDSFNARQTASPQFEANQYSAVISALGSAATAADNLRAVQLNLNSARAAGTIDEETYRRALSGAELDAALSIETRRLSLLGQFADVGEVVRAKQLEINKARQQGVDISRDESALILASTVAQRKAADLQVRAANDVITADEMMAQRKRELDIQVAAHVLTQGEENDALARYVRTTKDAIDAQDIRKASLQGLKQLELQASNLNQQIDDLLTTSMNDLASTLVDVASGTKDAGSAFSDLGKEVETAIEQMIVKMLIIAPIAKALQEILGGFGEGGSGASGILGFLGGLFGGLGGADVGTTTTGVLTGVYHNGGVVGLPGMSRMMASDIFVGAPRYHGGLGLQPDERAGVFKTGEVIGYPSQMRAAYGGGGTQVVNIHPPSGYDSRQEQSKGPNGEQQLDVFFDQKTAGAIQRRGSASNRAMRTNFGLSPALIER
jgi:hypothetical protein